MQWYLHLPLLAWHESYDWNTWYQARRSRRVLASPPSSALREERAVRVKRARHGWMHGRYLPSQCRPCLRCQRVRRYPSMRLVPGIVKLILPPNHRSMMSKLLFDNIIALCNRLYWHTSISSFYFCSEYDNSYSFGSPTDDWPSMSSPDLEESANKAVQSHMRRGPLKTIRRVAGRFKDILAQWWSPCLCECYMLSKNLSPS